MIPSLALCALVAYAAPQVESERLGVEMCLGTALLKDFKPSFGGSVAMIFITDDRLGASLGIRLLRNRGESIYREREPGTELVSARSSKYFTLAGFELNYILLRRQLTPYAGIGANWLYFHEQSEFVYYTPGWKVTTWKNFQGDGFCLSVTLGARYLIKPAVSMTVKMEFLLGKFYYPPLGDDLHVRGIALLVGMRL
jgi:hypothetical protein